MKKILNLIIAASTLAFATSCVGQKGETVKPEQLFIKLNTNSQQVDIDKAEKITFTVTANGADVTDKALIVNTSDGKYEKLVDKEGKNIYEYTPLKPAAHTFIALYNDNASEITQVRAYSSASQDETQFYRRSCVMKYTATSCTYCPDMGRAIAEASTKRPGRLIEIAVHVGDQLSNQYTTVLAKYASATNLPTVMVDYRNEKMIDSRTQSAILSGVDASISENPTFAGLKMTSKLENGKILVNVGTLVKRDGDYKLAVAIMMDGFAYEQTGSTDPNYRQNSVLRDFLCEDPYGEYLGKLIADERKEKSYEYALPVDADLTRYSVVAFILNKMPSGEYRVNNIIKTAVGATVDYEYEQKQ